MNKYIKILFACAFMCMGAAWAADDVGTVAARTDCAAVSAQIDELEKVANPDAATISQLDALRATWRSDCVRRVSGRAVGRSAVRTASDAPVVVNATTNALTQYLAARDENCATLMAAIDTGMSDVDLLEKMKSQYDADCVNVFDASVAAASAPVVETVELTAEMVTENLNSGLCADGTEPNKYGCCTGETFRDMGNAVFACCPDNGGDCFPPISKTIGGI